MTLSNAEIQRRYRKRALHTSPSEGGLLLTRLQTYLSPQSALNLNKLQRLTGKSKKALINQAIIELAEREGLLI